VVPWSNLRISLSEVCNADDRQCVVSRYGVERVSVCIIQYPGTSRKCGSGRRSNIMIHSDKSTLVLLSLHKVHGLADA
jgi:hypothetical protein